MGNLDRRSDAERHWFQQVVTGSAVQLPWDVGRPPYDPQAAFVCDRPSAEVVGYYRDQCAHSDAVLAVTPLSAAPRGRHGDPQMEEPPNLRWAGTHTSAGSAA